ncbi:MAG: exodeoxyribonuclease VII large subunit, partial [Microbacteriaceae bacterium]
AVWVEGELAQYNPKGAQAFLDIKDLAQEMRISGHSWNTGEWPADLKVGDRVVALIKPEFWPKSGKLSAQVLQIRKVGLGELLERLERLKQLLISEGLTADGRKQPLPFLPNRIGLITGAKSDAEKDVIENVLRRWPEAQFRVVNTKVQGDNAAPEVIAAIKALDADPEVDVIIIARGGGSFMDLVVFSDEALVRAAATARTPIVSAIGHENDSPLLDLVADLRASTPTDAAKRVVPDVVEERAWIANTIGRMELRIATFLENQLQFIAQLRQRPMLANPYSFVELKREDLTRASGDLRSALALVLERADADLGAKRQMLRSLSPQSTLDRGYSVLRDANGHVLVDASKVRPGTELKIRLAKGEIEATSK